MKKIILSLSFLLLTFLSFGQNISVESGMIKFNGISDYLFYADDVQNRASLISFSGSTTVNTLSKQSTPLDDDIIPDFLKIFINTDNMFIIGNYLVKFDFDNSRLLVINKNASDAYNTLKNNIVSQPGVISLGFDEEYEGIEFFEGLENGTVNESNYTNLISPSVVAGKCARADFRKADFGEVWSTLKMHEHFLDGYNYDYQVKYKSDYKLVYQRFLIYYRILGKAKCRTSFDNTFTHEIKKDIRIYGQLRYDIRCNGEKILTHDVTNFTRVNDWVAYDGGRSLSRFDFTINMQTKHAWESTYNHDVPLRIFYGY